jgi:hypothetical protein
MVKAGVRSQESECKSQKSGVRSQNSESKKERREPFNMLAIQLGPSIAVVLFPNGFWKFEGW